MDIILRNASVIGRNGTFDIGIDRGQIVAIGPRLGGGRGNRSRRPARRAGLRRDPHPSRQVLHPRPLRRRDEALAGSADRAGRDGEARLHRRGCRRARERTLEKASSTARRTCAPTRGRSGVGLRGFEGVKPLIADYRWAIDIEICVFPQEGLLNNPGHRRADGRGPRARRDASSAARPTRQRPARPDRPRSSSWRASSTSTSTCTSTSASTADDLDVDLRLRADREVRLGRPGRGRPRHQALAAAAGRLGELGSDASPTPAWR